MKKIVFFTISFFFSQIVFAQEQITNFENLTDTSPKFIKYVGQVNGKVLFTAWTAEAGNELWVSDGSKEGTKVLTALDDAMGGIADLAEKDGTVYFIRGGVLWKVNGSLNIVQKLFDLSSEIEYSDREHCERIICINNNVILTTSTYKNGYSSKIYSMNTDESFEVWEQDVKGYSIGKNILFFEKKTNENQYDLYKFIQNKQLIYSSNEQFGFNQIQDSSKIYCFISTYNSTNQKILETPNDDSEEVKIYDWGNHRLTVPWYVRDKNFQLHLIKVNSYTNLIDSLFLYDTYPNLKLRNKVFSKEQINDGFHYTGGTPFITNFNLLDNKITYLNGFITEGALVSFFNDFDFNTNKATRINLPVLFSYEPPNSVKQLNDSTYTVNSNTYQFTYNLITNTVSNWINSIYIAKTNISLKGVQYELSDNIYKVENEKKISLIDKRNIFSNVRYPLERYEYKGALFITSQNKIYKIDKHNNSKQFFIIENLYQKKEAYYDIEMFEMTDFSDKLYFTFTDEQFHYVYESEGTEESIKLIYQIKKFPTAYSIRHGNNFLIFSGSKYDEILVIFNDNKSLVLTQDANLFFTSNRIFQAIQEKEGKRNLYQVGKDEKVLIAENVENVFIDRTKTLYYTSNKQLYYHSDFENKEVLIANYLDYLLNFGESKYWIARCFGNKNKWSYIYYDWQKKEIVYNFEVNEFTYNIGFMIDSKSNICLKDSCYILDLETKNIIYRYKTFEGNVVIYKNGIFFKYYDKTKNIEYYDFKENKMYDVGLSSEYGMRDLNDNIDFVIFPQITYSNAREDYVWIYKTKKLQKISSSGDSYLIPQKGNYISGYNSQGNFYWSLQSDNLVQGLHPAKRLQDIPYIDIRDITFYNLPATGDELIIIGNDFTVYCPEFVKGPEGMTFGSSFIINNSLYIYAFTYTHGWQVWKMGETNIPVSQEEKEHSVLVYPNPATNYVGVLSSKNLQYQLINLQGQVQLKGIITNNDKIDVSTLPQGVYLLMLSDGTQRVVKKIIKN